MVITRFLSSAANKDALCLMSSSPSPYPQWVYTQGTSFAFEACSVASPSIQCGYLLCHIQSSVQLPLLLSPPLSVYVCAAAPISEVHRCTALQQGARCSEQHFGSNSSSKEGKRREGEGRGGEGRGDVCLCKVIWELALLYPCGWPSQT